MYNPHKDLNINNMFMYCVCVCGYVWVCSASTCKHLTVHSFRQIKKENIKVLLFVGLFVLQASGKLPKKKKKTKKKYYFI